VQTVAFLLTNCWFDCGLPDPIREEAEALSPEVTLWIRDYGLSPIEALFAPNKDELWLNLCLVDSLRDKMRVLSRRLLPIAAANPRMDAESGGKKAIRRSAILLNRAGYHACLLPAACAQGLRWWWRCQGLGRAGYGPTLTCCAAVIVIAAGLFYTLVRR
jgi:hypothetical protein